MAIFSHAKAQLVFHWCVYNKLGYLKDSNATEHSVDIDIFHMQ